jgi:hypothetical protein
VEPDHDYYQETWFQILIFYLLLTLIFITTIVLFLPRTYLTGKLSKGQQLSYLIPTDPVNFIAWIPLAFMMGAVNFALFSLLAENWTILLIARVCIAISTYCIYTICMMFTDIGYDIGVCGFACCYIAICISMVIKVPGSSSTSS